jgi:light-regulated signal transduction histidine kinase (bacteriophytochrome)
VAHCAALVKILDVNKQTLTMFETTDKQALLSNLSQVFTPDSFQVFREEIVTLSQGQSNFEAEAIIKTLQGNALNISLKLFVPSQNADSLDRVQLSISDITRRKQAELALTRQARELARSNKELEQFAYVASHDLQEPLRMITSYLQLLERRYQDKLDNDAREFIAYAVDGAGRMKTLINDLLAYSRVGTQPGQFDMINTETVLTKVLTNLHLGIMDHKATITQGPLPTVWADAGQLEQLLQNLISNGLKFHGSAPPQIHIGAREEENQWLFWVQDNGIGFEPEFAQKIFVIFQRLHGREEYPGTGIGLAICKKIVERHGGRIWVESQPGQGATFYFTLPHNN